MEETDNFLIFRVSWVFGIGRQNFLYKLAEMAKTRRILKIVADQVSVLTYTEDIVRVTMVAVERRPYFSAMSHARLSKTLGCEIPDWRDAIDRFIRREG